MTVRMAAPEWKGRGPFDFVTDFVYTRRPMATERTLSILKPDPLQSGAVRKILAKFEAAGLKPVAMKMVQLPPQEAEGFYAVHRERPFFKSLCAYMTSGPVVVQVLEGDNAASRTAPADARKSLRAAGRARTFPHPLRRVEEGATV